jgi:hypothetical protein
MKVKTSVKAGGLNVNHNQVQVCATPPTGAGLKVRTTVKAGGLWVNHNQVLVRAR